jgi:hypothetical protein
MTHRLGQGHASRATRRFFGVLVVCWLNLAILPCAMALNSGEHCLPESAAGAQGMEGHAGHHVVEQAPDCDMLSANCCDLVDAAFSGTDTKSKVSLDDLHAIVSAPGWPVLNVDFAAVHDARPPDPGGIHTPLHVLFCVYLK